MTLSDLLPLDVLLYRPSGLFGRLIALKTWSRYSHVEVYDGRGLSVASRDGLGVSRYPYRASELAAVLRPTAQDLNLLKARAWFKTVNGQGYDWLGLVAFWTAKRQGIENGAMFCSEFATRYLRMAGCDPFNGYDADGIAPGEFLKSPCLRVLWREDIHVEAARTLDRKDTRADPGPVRD